MGTAGSLSEIHSAMLKAISPLKQTFALSLLESTALSPIRRGADACNSRYPSYRAGIS